VPLPDTTRRSIDDMLNAFCAKRVPAHLHDQIRLDFQFRGDSVTLYEERPAYFNPRQWVKTVVAQFRYSSSSNTWTLYCADRNSRWHKYMDTEATPDFHSLLDEINEDPTGIFWG